MFCLSQTSNHAIRAVSCLSEGRCAGASIQTVSECTGIPKPYLAKVIKRLVDAGIVVSKRGVGGGIALSRPLNKINLYQISEAIEGKDFLSQCMLGQNQCSDTRACPTHKFWKQNRARIRTELERTCLDTIQAFEANHRLQQETDS